MIFIFILSLSSPSLSTYYKNLFTVSFFNYSWTDTSARQTFFWRSESFETEMELNEIFLGSRFPAAHLQRTHHSKIYQAYQNYSPVKRRALLWCTQTIAFLLLQYLHRVSETVLNIFVVCPAILLIHTYVYYMLVCHITSTHGEEEEKRRTSYWRFCCNCDFWEVRIKYLGAVGFNCYNGISCDTMCRFKSRVLDDSFGVFI